ncbi:MAG: hypothetical protein RPU39_00370 [Candidatus Sedimenticola sp. (ex Thyasira tokunagai)]
MEYSDEYIEFYGDLYLANWALLQSRGIRFDAFLIDPAAILYAAAFNVPTEDDGHEYRQLLPIQAELQVYLYNEEKNAEDKPWIDAFWDEINTTGPKPITTNAMRLYEPMTHTVYPTTNQRERSAFHNGRAVGCR